MITIQIWLVSTIFRKTDLSVYRRGFEYLREGLQFLLEMGGILNKYRKKSRKLVFVLSENYLFDSFQIERNKFVVTDFLLIWKQFNFSDSFSFDLK